MEQKTVKISALQMSSVIGDVDANISKVGKGYGFVKFSEQSESLTAINEMNGKVLCGRQIKTK